jgi:ATPase complex subunit ATP10
MSSKLFQLRYQIRTFSTSQNHQFLGKLNRQIAATKPKEYVVESLTKPIGLENEPTIEDNKGDQRSIYRKYKDFLDPKKNKARQAELEKEISKGGMYNVYTYRKTNGKFFIAPPSYWKADKALFFPNFYGETLLNSKLIPTLPAIKGKITVIRAYTSQLGEKASQSFFKTTDTDYLAVEGHENFKSTFPNSQIVDFNITENGLKAFFIKLSKSGLRKITHESRHGKYFIIPRKNISLDLREQIHLENTYGGFIYVLDHEGKIRWVACGEASDAERNLLWRTVRGLEREYRALNPEN